MNQESGENFESDQFKLSQRNSQNKFSSLTIPMKLWANSEAMDEEMLLSPLTRPFWSDKIKREDIESPGSLFQMSCRQRTDSFPSIFTSRQDSKVSQDIKNKKSERCQLFLESRDSLHKDQEVTKEVPSEEVPKEVPSVFVLEPEDQTYEFRSIRCSLLQQVLQHHALEGNELTGSSQKISQLLISSQPLVPGHSMPHSQNLEQISENYSVQKKGVKLLKGAKRDLVGTDQCEEKSKGILAENPKIENESHDTNIIQTVNGSSVLNQSMINNSSLPHKLLILDCRFYFEYIGGHINTAINIGSPLVMSALFSKYRSYLQNSNFFEQILALEGRQVEVEDLEHALDRALKKSKNSLISAGDTGCYDSPLLLEESAGESQYSTIGSNSQMQGMFSRTLPRTCIPVIVFHCEFSSKRAPSSWRCARSIDRELNSARYPHLDFPQMYILKDGYCKFVSESGFLCSPAHSYTPMMSPDHKKIMHAEEKKRLDELALLKKNLIQL